MSSVLGFRAQYGYGCAIWEFTKVRDPKMDPLHSLIIKDPNRVPLISETPIYSSFISGPLGMISGIVVAPA